MAASKPYHHGYLRAALLDASLALIRKEGLHGFTLREVARRAGVSHAAPYRHFRNKNDLLAAIAEDGFNRFTAKMREAASKGDSPLERLQMAGIAYVQFGLDRPEEFEVVCSVTTVVDDLFAPRPVAPLDVENEAEPLLDLAAVLAQVDPP